MSAKTFREKSSEDLQADIAADRREILDLKIKESAKSGGSAPLKVRFLRRDIARRLTILREREIDQ